MEDVKGATRPVVAALFAVYLILVTIDRMWHLHVHILAGCGERGPVRYQPAFWRRPEKAGDDFDSKAPICMVTTGLQAA